MPAKKFSMDDFAAELGEKLKQNRKPNIKKYRPHEKQHAFHTSTKHGKLYIGGNRSGKTTGGVCEDIWRSTCTHPYRPELNRIGPNKGRIIAVDFIKGVDQIILPQFKDWLYPSALINGSWEDSYNGSAHLLTFANGSTIEFMSYDQDLDKFAGTSRHWAHFDEEPPKPIWQETLMRLLDTDGDYWITMTPVEGMTWIYDDLYEPNLNNADGVVEIIEVNTLENPYLGEAGIRNVMAAITDDDEQSMRLGGTFVQQGGRVYKNFEPTPAAPFIPGAQVLKEHVDEPRLTFNQEQWLWVMGLDHGLNNPTAVVWVAFDPNGFGVVFDEYYQTGLTVDKNAANIKVKIKDHGRFPDILIADPSIWNNNAISGTSIHEEYIKYGLPFVKGNNAVKDGIVRVKKYLQPGHYYGQRRPHFFQGTGFKGLEEWPRLLVDPKCGNFIWEAKRYRWKTYQNKKLQFENNPYDEPHKKDDHLMDALRYVIMSRPDITANDNTDTDKKVKNIMEALDRQIAMQEEWDIDDPFDASERGFTPSLGIDSPANSGWQFDEHLGGLM